MTKYEEYFKKMLDENAEAFANFKEVHDAYAKDTTLQQEYNDAGKPILDVIRDYEDRLCNRSEGSGYGAYAGNLADKFWSLVRQEYPLIDRVGVIIRTSPVKEEIDDFTLNKIEIFEVKKITLS